jgi:mannosyl-oligosaccharide alpha-1,3-glucosidase
VNGYASLVGNAFDTLQFSAPDAPHDFYYIENDQVVTGYEIGMSFILQTERIWGLPQRAADMFQLATAGANDPYRLFNQDKYWHPYGSLDPLYGSYPYLTGHLTNADMSVLWMNSAETFVQINDTNNSFESDAFAMLGSFTSVGGAFEFWAIGSANGPKQNHKYLTEITGRPPMPPVHSLGFHYSKYEENSAELMLTRNEEFTKYGFPVDVFWSDLYYTEQFEYFVFNYENWPIDKVEELNRAIALS